LVPASGRGVGSSIPAESERPSAGVSPGVSTGAAELSAAGGAAGTDVGGGAGGPGIGEGRPGSKEGKAGAALRSAVSGVWAFGATILTGGSSTRGAGSGIRPERSVGLGFGAATR
jgi:hypothetical protein